MFLGGSVDTTVYFDLLICAFPSVILILSSADYEFSFHSLPLTAILLISFHPPLLFSPFPNLQKNEGDLFHRLWHVMNEILDLRRQVLVGHLTHDRLRDVKQHITARLDWGNE